MIRGWTFTCVLLTLTGCTSYHNLTDSPEVHRWHVVGKSYVAVRDLSVIHEPNSRGFPYVDTSVTHPAVQPRTLIPRATVLCIHRIVEEEIPLATTYTHPLATVTLDGKPAQVSLWQAMEFAGSIPAAANQRYLRPYPPLDVSTAPVETLRQTLGDPDYVHRYYAVLALSARPLRNGERESRLAAACSDPDPDVRLLALESLKALGPQRTPEVIAAFVRALIRHPGVNVERMLAQGALLAIGPDAVPEILRAIDREPTESNWSATGSLLEEFGPAAAPHLPAIISVAAAHPTSASALSAAVGRIDPRAAVRLLTPKLRDPATRATAARLMFWAAAAARYNRPTSASSAPIPAEADPAIDALIACLDDPDVHTRVAAATALMPFGPLARRALPALERLRSNVRNNPADLFYPRHEIDQAIEVIATDTRPVSDGSPAPAVRARP